MYYTITPSAHVVSSALQQVFDCRDIFELKPYGDTRSSQSAGFDFYIKRSIDFETNNKFQVQLLAQVSKPSNTMKKGVGRVIFFLNVILV